MDPKGFRKAELTWFGDAQLGRGGIKNSEGFPQRERERERRRQQRAGDVGRESRLNFCPYRNAHCSYALDRCERMLRASAMCSGPFVLHQSHPHGVNRYVRFDIPRASPNRYLCPIPEPTRWSHAFRGGIWTVNVAAKISPPFVINGLRKNIYKTKTHPTEIPKLRYAMKTVDNVVVQFILRRRNVDIIRSQSTLIWPFFRLLGLLVNCQSGQLLWVFFVSYLKILKRI